MATYKVKDDGKAQKGLSAGDEVVTAGGTYKITGVNADGSYKSERVSDTTTSNYKGSYANGGSSSKKSTTSAPSGFKGSATGVKTYDTDQSSIREQMNANSQKWWSATKEEQEQLHAANEALSRLLNENGGDVGYDSVSGTWSGSAGKAQPTTTPQKTGAGNYTDFVTEDAPVYENRYDEQINDTAQDIIARDPFSYDSANDPLYKYFANMYQRNGERAMRDTLGELSARTGGLASSYAGSMAQGSYNEYMQGLNDIVPELYNLAYSIYQNEGDEQRANLEMLQALEQGDYAKYRDLLSQWNTDRSFDYGLLSDQIGLDYQRERDALADAQDAREWQYKLQQDAEKTASGAGASSSGNYTGAGGGDEGGDGNGLFSLADDYALTGGDPKDFIKANWRSYGFKTQSEALSAYNVYLTQSSSTSSSLGVGGAPTFTQLRQTILTLKNQGSGDRAYELYDTYFDDMSDAQKEEINKLLGA